MITALVYTRSPFIRPMRWRYEPSVNVSYLEVLEDGEWRVHASASGDVTR
jgi:hypothetical protein